MVWMLCFSCHNNHNNNNNNNNNNKYGESSIVIIIIIIKIFIAHSYQFKIASEALKVCKRL